MFRRLSGFPGNQLNLWPPAIDLMIPSKKEIESCRMSTQSTNQSEETLIRAAQAGGRGAFSQLVERYDRRLLYFVRRLMRDEQGAFDVLQVIWLSVHRRIRNLRSPDAFRPWVYRIAHDCAVTELRRRGKRLEVSIDSQTETLPHEKPSEDYVFDQIELVHRGLKELSFEHRRVLTLKFLEDMSIEQIAEVVGAQPGTVKSRLHYAKAALRCWIEDQES